MAGRAVRPVALIATAVVLVAFALGGWVPVPRTIERARTIAADPRPATDPGRVQAEKAGIDVDAAVDKVRHRVTPAEDGTGALGAHDEQYRARFDATGFGFTLAEHPSRFGVSLRGVQRGGDDLVLVPGAWRGEANVAVRGLGSGMTERVTARAGELEWDVVLDRPLLGAGDLRLEAELRGIDGVATRLADHWRFSLGDGQAAHMGEVVVKDATGAELHRALPRVRGDIVRLDVPASVLANARYPLTIDPTVGPELTLNADPDSVEAAGHAPAVAWNGTDFLVVWQDGRSDSSLFGGDIYGTRVNGAGTVLDPFGIPISTATNQQEAPAVASDGTNFLVVWEDLRGGVNQNIFGARVTAAGSVLDPAGIQVSSSGGNSPALAWNGTNFLVAWTNSDIYGARVSAAGSVLDPAGIAISTAVRSQFEPAVASDGIDFLVVWTDQRSGGSNPEDIYGARVSAAGSVLDPAGIPISTATNRQWHPDVAWNGTDFLVVWEDRRLGSRDIYGARVSGAGAVLDPAGIPISTASIFQEVPAVTWDGTNFLVVWQDYRSNNNYDSYGARVSGTGTVLDPAGIPVSTAAGDQTAPVLAWSGTHFLVVWGTSIQNPATSSGEIRGARVSGAGAILDPAGFAISLKVNDQSSPAAAWNGTDFLVVWADSRGIYATRVSGDGTVLDPAGIAISTAAHSQFGPELAWNGTNFLVVWTGPNYDIYGARVTAAGTVLDPAGIAISTAAQAQSKPELAWNGTDFLVVWEDWRNNNELEVSDIYGARVSAAGAVLDPTGIPIAPLFVGFHAAPAVASNGRDFLVVWEDATISGARVSGAGSVLDPSSIPISTGTSRQANPAVASWGDNYFVVWEDHRNSPCCSNWDIYGARVSAAGDMLTPSGIAISTAAGNQTNPDLAVRYDFLIAWADNRSGTNSDVYATRVSPSGAVREPAGVLVAGAPNPEGAVAVTGGPGSTWAVAYARFVPEAPYGAFRVFMRTVSPK